MTIGYFPAIHSKGAARLGAVLALLAAAGCMPSPPPPAPPAPAAVPLPPAPAVAAPRLPAPPPVAAPAVPAGPMGPVDARTGLHQAALISVTGDADSRFTLLFRPASTDAARIQAAPEQLCRQAGRELKDSRTNTPGAASAMPGVQMMIVTCSAA